MMGSNINLMSLQILIKIYGVCVFALCFLLICNGVEVAAFKNRRSPSKASQPYRTAYHFQPSKNWMNDPNGPMYYKGVYHLFYQYNPYGPLWGNMSWGHAISYDLINWLHLDIALLPNESYDIKGCFSGSTTILPNGEPTILYTGVDANGHQVQNLAFPRNTSDPRLNEWVKSSLNPILSPPDGIDPSMYRDPSTGWMGPDGEWRVVIGSQLDHQGSAVLYKSKDFNTWIRSPSPLHFSKKTTMWECPDFYPVIIDGKNGLDTSIRGKNIRHVLKASFNNRDYYVLGTYDPKTDQYIVDADFMDRKGWLLYDYGRFYASKSFYDGEKKRRIVWSWVNEGDTEADAITKGWSGLQMSTNNSDNTKFSLKSILENAKLDNSNFMDWYRNLKIVLRAEKKAYVLEGPIPEAPATNTGAARRTWEKHVDDSQDVTCLMLAMMIPELQKNLENLGAYEMSEQLKNMFQQQARHERFEVMRSLITCRMQEGTSVSAHVLKMKSFVDQLERLNAPLSNELATDVILNSLPNSYHQFVMNYNMNGWERTIPELHQMLKTAETNIPTKGNPVLAIREGKITKKKQSKGKSKASKQDKGKGKKVATPKAKPHKDAKCFHCDEIGHWKRNCPKYLAELKLKKLQIGESSGTKKD